jgi:hypothetical protein
MEYDPEPPLRSGNPKTADLSTIQQATAFMVAHAEKQAEQWQYRVATD